MTAINIAYINIGTNQGHRQSNLDCAVALLCRHMTQGAIEVSDTIESEPWGYDSPNQFLNIGVRIPTTLGPNAMLELLQQIEHEMSSSQHRDASGQYVDRVIDLDLIAMTRPDGSDYIIDTPRLTLPHPRMHLRDFVLAPMAQLAPRWRHPLFGKTASELRALLS